MILRLTILLPVLLVFGGLWGGGKVVAAIPPEAPRDRQARPVRKDAYGDPLPQSAVARLGTLRFRVASRTLSVAYCSNGKVVASGDNSGAVRLWNLTTGEELALVYSPEKERDSESKIKGRPQNQRVLFSPDGQYLLYSGKGGLHLWEVSTNRFSPLSIDLGPVAFSPDGNLLAGGRFREFVIFDIKKRIARFHLAGSQEWIRAVAFSPDGKLVATSESQDFNLPSIIRLWNADTGKQIADWVGHARLAGSLSFRPDGKVLASGGSDNICLWDVDSRRKLATLNDHAEVVAFSPDGKLLASANYRGAVHIWNSATYKHVRTIHAGNGWAGSIAFSPDGKKLLTGGGLHAIRLWDVDSGRPSLPLLGHENTVLSLQFSPEGKMLASRSADQTVRLWELSTSKQLHCFLLGSEGRLLNQQGLPQSVCSVAFSPDSKTVAAIGGTTKKQEQDKTIHLWEVASGQTLADIDVPREHPFAIAFSPDGQTLASLQRGSVRLWSASKAAEQGLLPVDLGSYCLAFSSDGHTLAAGGTGPRISLWDWRTRREIRSFPARQYPTCLAFSSGGQMLVSCGYAAPEQGGVDNTIHLWEPANGTHIHALKEHQGRVACVAISPDGRLLASSGEDDHTVRIWDTFNGNQLAKYTGHRGPVYGVAFSPDGKTVASGSADTTVLLWDVSKLQAHPPSTKGDPEELARLWTAMREQEAAKSYRALWAFIGADEKAVAFLRQQIRPIPTPDAKQIHQLIADLDSEEFHKRESAARQLTRLGELAEPAMQQALKEKPKLEVRKRLEQILEGISPLPTTPEELRQARALHALELIGSPAARDLLKKLAGGAPGARLTRNAKLALQRLERRAKQP